jgi:hypothetical protein
MFTIDEDYNITVCDAGTKVADNVIKFSSQREFGAATAAWPLAGMIALWNSFAGAPPFGELRPVNKFIDRNSAVKRIWTAIQKAYIDQPAITDDDVPFGDAAPATDKFSLTVVGDVDTPEAFQANIAPEEEQMPKSAKKTTKKTAKTKPPAFFSSAAAPQKAKATAPAASAPAKAGGRKEQVLNLTGRTNGATLA